MRLTKKHIRQMILEQMNMPGTVAHTATMVPSMATLDIQRDKIVQKLLAVRIEGMGQIWSQQQAEEEADERMKDRQMQSQEPLAGAGMSTSYGAPRNQPGMMPETVARGDLRNIILREMKAAGTHAGALEMMQDEPVETVMFEPSEEVPSADDVADAVEGIQDQGLLAKVWSIIKNYKGIFPEDPADQGSMLAAEEEYAAMTPSQRIINDPSARYGADTYEEGYEPGSYRAEGDMRLNEVSIGVGRWNLLAGTDK